MDLIRDYVAMRFRLWGNREETIWVIYEAFPEEGPDVSKKLKTFNNPQEANEWLTEHRRLWRKWLLQWNAITASSPPTETAPSTLTTTRSLQEARSRRSGNFASMSPETSQPEPSESTSSETSTASSPTSNATSFRTMRMQAKGVIASDRLEIEKGVFCQILTITPGKQLKFVVVGRDQVYAFPHNKYVTVERTAF